MVNSCNSGSPILLDTPEHHSSGAGSTSLNGIIEINDSGGHPRSHVARRRRLDQGDDVIVTDSSKRPRMDVPVIDLTSDNDEDISTLENDIGRVHGSMPEQAQTTSRRIAELRVRLRRALMSRHRLSHARYHVEDYHGNASNNFRSDTSRNQLVANAQNEDETRMPILVDDDESGSSSGIINQEEEFSLPSCSRVNPSRIYLPPTTSGNGRPTFPSSRSERSRIPPHHSNAHSQASNNSEGHERSSFNNFRETLHTSARGSRSRHNQRRRQLRDCLAYLSPPSLRNPSRANFEENQATGGVQSPEYQTSSRSINETLPSAIPDIEHQPPRRYSPRGLSTFEQPLQPYIPDLLIPAVLSIWNTENLHHFPPEEEREDYEALWNLTERLGQVKPKGLSKADMEDIPSFRFSAASKDFSNGSCVVCMMNYSNKEKLRRLPCNHDFHAKCIDRWLKNNRSCPVCRKDVTMKL